MSRRSGTKYTSIFGGTGFLLFNSRALAHVPWVADDDALT